MVEVYALLSANSNFVSLVGGDTLDFSMMALVRCWNHDTSNHSSDFEKID